MQEGRTDYSEKEIGCCLNCEKSHPGCLCYECKCKKCYWYDYIGLNTGVCDLVDDLKEERQKKQEEIKEEQKRKYPNATINYSRIGLHNSQKQLNEESK